MLTLLNKTMLVYRLSTLCQHRYKFLFAISYYIYFFSKFVLLVLVFCNFETFFCICPLVVANGNNLKCLIAPQSELFLIIASLSTSQAAGRQRERSLFSGLKLLVDTYVPIISDHYKMLVLPLH